MALSSKAYKGKDHARSAEIALLKRWGLIGYVPYHPFIPVRRFAGSGFSGRLICPRTRQLIDCHSKGEINWARILLWEDDHHFLYAQVVMPRQDTIRIAKVLGIRHPKYPGGTPTVMTCDFVHVTHLGDDLVYTAYAIKLSREKLTPRKRDLLRIEEAYFEEQQIPWCLKFKDEANQVKLANIRAVDSFVGVSPFIWGSEKWKEYEPALFAKVSGGMAVNLACKAVEAELGMLKNSALTLVRFFIANRIWRIDWFKRFDPLCPLTILERRPHLEL